MSVLRRGSAQVGEMFPDWLEILMVYGCISSTYVPDELVKMHSAFELAKTIFDRSQSWLILESRESHSRIALMDHIDRLRSSLASSSRHVTVESLRRHHDR